MAQVANDPVDVQLGSNTNVPNGNHLGGYAKAAMEGDPGTLCIRVVGEDEGRELNLRFCSRDHATNVLSFVSELPDSLGDIAICAPVVEAEGVGQQLAEEMVVRAI